MQNPSPDHRHCSPGGTHLPPMRVFARYLALPSPVHHSGVTGASGSGNQHTACLPCPSRWILPQGSIAGVWWSVPSGKLQVRSQWPAEVRGGSSFGRLSLLNICGKAAILKRCAFRFQLIERTAFHAAFPIIMNDHGTLLGLDRIVITDLH